MKKQIDHFLLGLLWLLASSLGASFWFNTRFGFNIFATAHWQYFGQLQASGVHINIWFYISLILSVFIMIFGLYLLVRPRFRRIKISDTSGASTEAIQTSVPENIIKAPEEVTHSVPDLTRPPRLNLPRHNSAAVAAPVTPIISAPVIPQSFEVDISSELEEIFKSSGYTVKTSPRFGTFRPALWAMGSDEVLWVGTNAGGATDLETAIKRLRTLFNDTLDADIQINIRGFIVGSNSAIQNPEIEVFETVEDLRNSLKDRKNRAIDESEQEDFDAYVEYIDTVADYFNKL